MLLAEPAERATSLARPMYIKGAYAHSYAVDDAVAVSTRFRNLTENVCGHQPVPDMCNRVHVAVYIRSSLDSAAFCTTTTHPKAEEAIEDME